MGYCPLHGGVRAVGALGTAVKIGGGTGRRGARVTAALDHLEKLLERIQAIVPWKGGVV